VNLLQNVNPSDARVRRLMTGQRLEVSPPTVATIEPLGPITISSSSGSSGPLVICQAAVSISVKADIFMEDADLICSQPQTRP
jgi:hypothetical protein